MRLFGADSKEQVTGGIHLLITDGIMPKINGWDLAERLAATLDSPHRAAVN